MISTFTHPGKLFCGGLLRLYKFVKLSGFDIEIIFSKTNQGQDVLEGYVLHSMRLVPGTPFTWKW